MFKLLTNLHKMWWTLGLNNWLFLFPWTTRGLNLSILKEINPEYSLEGLMLKLKHQSFGHLMWKADSLEKTLMLEKIEGRRRRGRQLKLKETVKVQEAWCATVHSDTKRWTGLSNWTSTTYYIQYNLTVVKKNYLHTNINNTYTYQLMP